MTEREKLIEELMSEFAIKADGKTRKLATFDHLADFIIKDRLRVVEPLVKLDQDVKLCHPFVPQGGWNKCAAEAINQTLKLAGAIK